VLGHAITGPLRHTILVDLRRTGGQRPSEEALRRAFDLSGDAELDVFYLSSEPWAALGNRDLNPADPVCGKTHSLIEKNLRGALLYPRASA
jgi:hypothetical protein